MNRYRGPTYSAPSRATASTVCQKCLKRGHYSYECTAGTQERPYTSRPSRTQQLLNPKLVPKLTSDVSNDLLRKKGIADEQLAKREAERNLHMTQDPTDGATSELRKLSRSRSSSSSVSTISTGRSRSRSPQRASYHRQGQYYTSQRETISRSPYREHSRKRRRSNGSNRSFSSHSDQSRSIERDRNTRRRRSSNSPAIRGRKPLRSRSPSARSPRNSRSPRRSLSPRDYDRHSKSSPRRSDHYRSRDHSIKQRSYPRGDHSVRRRNAGYPHSGDRRLDPLETKGETDHQLRRERSLSPFSKRLALTQAMNMGK